MVSEEATQAAAEKLQDYLNEKSLAFMQLREERHAAGAEEYGQLTFLGNDVVRMMIEELADTANYCEMQAIKLLILQDTLEEELDKLGVTNDDGPEIEIGFRAFKGTKDVGWRK